MILLCERRERRMLLYKSKIFCAERNASVQAIRNYVLKYVTSLLLFLFVFRNLSIKAHCSLGWTNFPKSVRITIQISTLSSLQGSTIIFRRENTDSYLKRLTPRRFDTVSLRVKYHRVHSLSKQDQNTVHNAHDQMRWFGKLTDRGDMGGLDGLVTNENKLVSVSLRRLCLTTIWRRLSSWAELTYITALDTYIHQKKK